jgi:exopolyphosphatase/guanosine-5'-triphosphate,3'-diphosphate pyrophosphatase
MVTSIAAIDQGLKKYNPEQMNGSILEAVKIKKFIEEFSTTASGTLEARYPLFLKGRSDVILAGVMILDGFLKRAGSDTVTVSTGGIRHGVLLEQISPAGQDIIRVAYDIQKDSFFE